MLAADPAAASAVGNLFEPPCQLQKSCDSTAVLNAFVDPSLESMVWQKCVPVAKITQKQNVLVTGLTNDTTYKVLLITADVYK
jgi:hypothetical protein